jgi:ssRNA-specific RNase YbeY (16S rRNA maturation enzyme)
MTTLHALLHARYDHETDSDWAVMTSKEDEIVAKLKDALAAQNGKQP